MKVGTLFLAPLLLALGSASAFAADSGPEDLGAPAKSADIIDFSRLLTIAREHVSRKKFLDATFSMKNDRAVMELFFLADDGQVISVRMDAETAAVIDDDAPSAMVGAGAEAAGRPNHNGAGDKDDPEQPEEGGDTASAAAPDADDGASGKDGRGRGDDGRGRGEGDRGEGRGDHGGGDGQGDGNGNGGDGSGGGNGGDGNGGR